jgi:hypothetical protein
MECIKTKKICRVVTMAVGMPDPKSPESPEETVAPRPAHHVSRATYPIPEPLARRLKAGILLPPSDAVSTDANANATPPPRQVESLQEALTFLVGNSIEAMDAMYFATPARIRKHASFQHRLCLRVRADSTTKTLSITDLGIGMTRADVINSLGVGRAGLLASSRQQSKEMADSADEEEEEDDMEETTEDDVGSDDEEEDGDDEGEEESGHEQEDASSPEAMPCRAVDLGGFYAAFCALGTGARVGTKSKFDDYYEFEVGVLSDGQNVETAFQDFCITRPREEGTELTAENGFDQFQDIRGDSGTCVTIRLNQDAVDAGLLDEDKLKAIFQKIGETTQYTVAFSSDDDAQAIIEASEKEKTAVMDLLKQQSDIDPIEAVGDMELGKTNDDASDSYNSVKERAKYIPLRLSLGERKMLRLVEASMNCCEYTSEVDRPFKSSARRTHEQLKGVTSVLRGLVTACDYSAGQKLLQDDNFAEYDTFFCQMFEIARRHKIMNPEKMRTEYGKLIYLLQDAVSPSVRPHLGFSVKSPIESVYKFLEERNGLALLSDKLIETATEEILSGKSRMAVDNQIKAKERAVAYIKKKYRTEKLSTEDIHLCLYSICDNNSFLNSNRVPVDKIIEFLQVHFSPDKHTEGYSLSIVSGEEGARLSHSHKRQYSFALQSLTLWRDIIDDMFRLWVMAEDDLLSESVTYSLQDTGQGMQRVQQSPRTYRAMQKILARVQGKVSQWIGSSVVHMGDHNVPNALSFIDKYTQGKLHVCVIAIAIGCSPSVRMDCCAHLPLIFCNQNSASYFGTDR